MSMFHSTHSVELSIETVNIYTFRKMYRYNLEKVENFLYAGWWHFDWECQECFQDVYENIPFESIQWYDGGFIGVYA